MPYDYSKFFGTLSGNADIIFTAGTARQALPSKVYITTPALQNLPVGIENQSFFKSLNFYYHEKIAQFSIVVCNASTTHVRPISRAFRAFADRFRVARQFGASHHAARADGQLRRTNLRLLTAWHGERPASYTYAYDANGNMTFDGRKGLEYHYNYLNLLEKAEATIPPIDPNAPNDPGHNRKRVIHLAR